MNAEAPRQLPPEQEAILRDFREWLTALPAEEAAETAPLDEPEPAGLYELVAEFAALRQEVKLQSRGQHTLGQQLEKVTHSMSDDVTAVAARLETAVQQLKSMLPEARRDAQKACAMELAALLEGLTRAVDTSQDLSLPVLLAGKRRTAAEEALRRPLELLLARALEAARRLELTPVAAVGDSFDSSVMRAVGRESSGRVPSGNVNQLITQGYRLAGALIRTAEVKIEA